MTDKLPMMPYPWQQEAWRQLQTLLDSGKLPHAMMLCGPVETGKYQFARAVAQRLLCESPVGTYSCGHCKQCLLVSAGSHPDIRELTPEEPGKSIKVDTVRDFVGFAAKTAQQGGWKVGLVSPVDAMNVNAANAFLKTLEEPAPGTLLLLVCHQPGVVLPTIRSRCRLMRFPVPAEGEVTDWLRQVTGEDQDSVELLRLAGGRPLRALRILQSDLAELQQDFLRLVGDVAHGQVSPLVAAEQCIRHAPVEAVDWFMQYLYGYLKSAGTPQGPKRLYFRFLDRLVAAKRRLQSTANPNVQLLWEELFLDWQTVSATTGSS